MAFVEEAIISGFIGEVVSRCVDFSWTSIKEAVKSKKDNHQNIESQIYNVVVNVLNQITYKKFVDNQDEIYQAAERMLRGYKDIGCGSIEVVRSGLQILGENVNENEYIQFKTLLYQELSKDDHEELYRQIRLFQQDKESEKTSRIEQKIDKVQQSVDETNQVLSVFKQSNGGVDNVQNKKPVKSRTQEYADKWNQNMFLNDFDKRDENAGVNIKLRDVYLDAHLPHYIWYKNGEDEPSTDLKELLSDYINEKRGNKMLLILGQPGIGKSTLITWITANFTERVHDILVYRFASDLIKMDWEDYEISNRMLEELHLGYDDLNGKTLILDGFDEINVRGDRKDVLDKMYWKLVKGNSIVNFSLIVTCRENYISKFERVACKFIILKPWDEIQIRSFCNIFQEKTMNCASEIRMEKICKNKEILGIPLILYMVLALNISIEKEGSIVDIYDKIFAIDGGIYDRCVNNKNFAEPHWIGNFKKQIHQISSEIAIWMFENKPVEAYIPKNEYQKIVNFIIQDIQEEEDTQQDFLIGSYFKLIKHCEGLETEKIYFVHRSIYEYFVTGAIYSSIENSMKKLTKESQKEFSREIINYLKVGRITNTIGEYLQCKLLKFCNGFYSKDKEKFYRWWEEAVESMINYGMFYCAEGEICNYRNIMDKEVQCFLNLIKILRLIFKTSKKQYI